MSLTAGQRATLLAIARRSIEHGLEHQVAVPVRASAYEPALQAEQSSFVTLKVEARLRGCIGSLQAQRPLVCDVAHQAFGAAFSDPRFPALQRAELPAISVDISILAPAEELVFLGEAELLRQLRPGIDGLIIDQDGRRATFLPSVWESLPEPADFLTHLKQKAGIPLATPVRTAQRYTTESFGE